MARLRRLKCLLLLLLRSLAISNELPECITATGENFWQCLAELDDSGTTVAAVTMPTSSNNDCVDQDERCTDWAQRQECARNPKYMLKACRKSCALCDKQRASSTEASCFGTDQNIVVGAHAKAVQRRLQEVEKYMLEQVFVMEKYEKVRLQCRNTKADCTFWAVAGECENNPGFMMSNCAPACLFCEMTDFSARCPYDPEAPGVWKAGDLDRFFRGLASNLDYQRRYNLIIHAHPQMRLPDNSDDSPWVLTLDNFLTDSECDLFVETGFKIGFERSQDVGAKQADGTFGSVTSEKRTSETAWFGVNTKDDQRIVAVLDRIDELTGIPYNNSEYIQILKYETGQQYERHHDYISHQIERAMGPRIMTVFLYLSDVEAGGGTHFPALNFTAQPKKGRVLIWPSVLDSDPNAKDVRTDHQALPVEKGKKFGANAWVHQRDFKTPHLFGCHK